MGYEEGYILFARHNCGPLPRCGYRRRCTRFTSCTGCPRFSVEISLKWNVCRFLLTIFCHQGCQDSMLTRCYIFIVPRPYRYQLCQYHPQYLPRRLAQSLILTATSTPKLVGRNMPLTTSTMEKREASSKSTAIGTIPTTTYRSLTV
jgi:hypothetical protein